MDYHMQYPLNEEIRQEKEAIVEKSNEGKIIFKKKKLLIIFFVSVFSIISLIIFYYIESGNKRNLLKENHNNNINDDYIIHSLLKSKNGKKFILSKLEELLLSYGKNNETDNEEQSENIKRNSIDKSVRIYKKKEGNLKFVKKEDYVDLYDTRFLMSNLEVVNSFYIFLKENEKKYKNSDEIQEKFHIFSQNYKKIEKHNRSNSLYTMGINQFSDLTFEQFEEKYLTLKNIDLEKDLPNSNIVNYHDLITKYKIKNENADTDTDNFDWREKYVISPVKDQKSCGSCWAFTVAGVIEAAYAIWKKETVSLSEQELVDCVYLNYGCNGGSFNPAFNYSITDGLCTEEEYPYEAINEMSCNNKNCNNKHKIKKYFSLSSHETEKAIKYIGPVAAYIAASENFIYYKSGIYDGDCYDIINHALIIVGYGVEEVFMSEINKTKKVYYYIVKNSWGTKWGENGYGRVIKDKYDMSHKCFLGSKPIGVIIDGEE